MHRIWVVTAVLSLIDATTSCAQPTTGSLPKRMQPGVRLGAGLFAKKLFASVDGIGVVTYIQRGKLRSPTIIEVGIAGAYGARFFDDRGTQHASVEFAAPRPEGAWVYARIVKQTSANEVSFFRQSRYAATYDSLTDSHGTEVWRTPFSTVASTFGDLTGSGVAEFIFASQDDAIEARNLAGSVLWRREKVGWATNMDLLQSQGREASEILISIQGKLVALNPNGESLFSQKPNLEQYFSRFSTMQWSPVCTQCLLISSNEHFVLLSSDGSRVLRRLSGGYLQDPTAIAVSFHGEAAPMLAIGGTVTYQGNRSAGYQAVGGEVYIFDSHGTLVYEEVLPERVDALGVIPSSDGKAETLLVGGENKVWQYSALGPVN